MAKRQLDPTEMFLFNLLMGWILLFAIYFWARVYRIFMHLGPQLPDMSFLKFATYIRFPNSHPVKRELIAKLPDSARTELSDVQRKSRIWMLVTFPIALLVIFWGPLGSLLSKLVGF